MRITQETDYAIRIVLLCAEHDPEMLSGNFIVETCQIPERWGKIILTKLCKNRILKSTKGKYGGFQIEKPLETITLFDVVDVFETIEFCQGNIAKCNYLYKNCAIHNKFHALKNDFIDGLKSAFVVDLLKEQQLIALKECSEIMKQNFNQEVK